MADALQSGYPAASAQLSAHVACYAMAGSGIGLGDSIALLDCWQCDDVWHLTNHCTLVNLPQVRQGSTWAAVSDAALTPGSLHKDRVIIESPAARRLLALYTAASFKDGGGLSEADVDDLKGLLGNDACYPLAFYVSVRNRMIWCPRVPIRGSSTFER